MDVFYTRPARLREGWSAGRFYIEGLTVLELLITLAVLGILLAIAVPSYTALVTSTHVAAQHNSLLGDLAFTRSEAIKRNQQAVICLSSDGASCGSGNHWDQGWIVFVDLDRDRAPDTDEPLLRRQEALTGDIEITYSAFGSDRYITYYPDGTTRQSNGTFSFCPTGSGADRALILAKTGRVRSSKTRGDGSPPCE